VKQHAVLLTDDAQADLQELYDYIAEHDVPAKTDAVLNKRPAQTGPPAKFEQPAFKKFKTGFCRSA
jgi:plasmid stabilization system protein ParE